MFGLEGRQALVTGAGQHAGAGVAQALASRGARVLVNDLIADRAEAVAAGITASGGDAAAVAFDVTVIAEVTSALAAVGPVDILVNNAGNGGAAGMVPKPFSEMAVGEWMGPIEVNLFGVIHCVHAVIGPMIERRWGRIITISSGAGTDGVGIGVAPYSAGKGGALGFMRSLALENAYKGVTANSVALGLMSNVGNADVVAALAMAVPAKRLGTPGDVAAACVYLASDEASWVTGQTLGVNGGSSTS